MENFLNVKLAVAYFGLIIVVAHFFAPAGYDWTANTISQLAAQKYEYAWLMRAGFIGFGLLLGVAILLKLNIGKQADYSSYLIIGYALCILLSGIFSAPPVSPDVEFNVSESQYHSIFATVAGVLFTAGILWHLIAYAQPDQRSFDIVLFMLVAMFSGLLGMSANGHLAIGFGLLQRGLYAVSFIWLWYRY